MQMFAGRGMTREQWAGVVSNMIGRGAQIVRRQSSIRWSNILARSLPPGNAQIQRQRQPRGLPRARRRRAEGSLIDQAGSDDKQVVDEDAAARGKTIYIAQCITCHGTRARGGDRGVPTWCDPSWFFMTAMEARSGLISRRVIPAGKSGFA